MLSLIDASQKKICRIRKQYSRNCFTQEEDELLIKLAQKFKEDWKRISEHMINRSVRQCKERYLHYLSPSINHNEWSFDEDILLLNGVEKYGKKWKVLENFFHRRTEIDIRNRFYVLSRRIKKQIRSEIHLNYANNINYNCFETINNFPSDQKNEKDESFDSSDNQIQTIHKNECSDLDNNNILFDIDFLQNDPDISTNYYEDFMYSFD